MGDSYAVDYAASISVSATLPTTRTDSPASNFVVAGTAAIPVVGAGLAQFEVTAVNGLTGTVEVLTADGGTWREWDSWQTAVDGTPTPRIAGTTITFVAGDMVSVIVEGFYGVRIKRAGGTSATFMCRTGDEAESFLINRLLKTFAGGTATWLLTHNPGANTKATATQASAGTGRKNVCTSFAFNLGGGASAPAAITVNGNICDGASGSTAIVSYVISIDARAGALSGIAMSNVWIVGSAATSMTLEFSAAGGANTSESVNANGQVI